MKILGVCLDASREHELCDALQSSGFQVETARSGRKASRRDPRAAPDVLITDWVLPETWFHGLHLVAALRRLKPEMRAVLTTDFATPDVGFDAVELGVHDILPSRVSPGRLTAAVCTALAHEPPARERPLYPPSLLERILDEDPPEPGAECPFGGRALIVDPSLWTRRLGVREIERIFCVAHSVAEPDWALHLLDRDPEIDLVIFDVDRNRLELKNLVERLMVRHPDVIRVAQGRDRARLRELCIRPEHFLQTPWSGKELLRFLLQ